MKHIVPHLSEEALLHENTLKVAWNQAHHWSEWWMRLPHLRMLSKVFAVESDLSGAPRDTNGVGRVNTVLHCRRKEYYRSKTDETRRQVAASRKRQHLQSICSDKDFQYGPPDKHGDFSKEKSDGSNTQVTIGQIVEVRYDNGVWYKGKLIEFSAVIEEWITQFDSDGELLSFFDEDVHLL